MPYGGNDWHALTREAVLEPDLPIIDPHHHLWDTPHRGHYFLPELLDDLEKKIRMKRKELCQRRKP